MRQDMDAMVTYRGHMLSIQHPSCTIWHSRCKTTPLRMPKVLPAAMSSDLLTTVVVQHAFTGSCLQLDTRDNS